VEEKTGLCLQARAGGAAERLTRAAQEYIQAHSAEKYSLKAISGAMYVNGSYLMRTFKASTGRTLLWYHNHVRCEKAKLLLADERLSVSEAGEEAGFVSSSHFSHMFRKMTGLTPTQYRRAQLGASLPEAGES